MLKPKYSVAIHTETGRHLLEIVKENKTFDDNAESEVYITRLRDSAFNQDYYLDGDIRIRFEKAPIRKAQKYRRIIPITEFEVQLISETRVSPASTSTETVTQRTSLILRNVAEAYSLFPNFDLMLYLYPESTLELLQNWGSSQLAKKFQLYDPELYRFLDGQRDIFQNALISTEVVPVCVTTWVREPVLGPTLKSPAHNTAEFTAVEFSSKIPKMTSSQHLIVRECLKQELQLIQRKFRDSTNEFRKASEKLQQLFSRAAENFSNTPGTVVNEFERLTSREQYNLIRFLSTQETRSRQINAHAKFSPDSLSLLLPDKGQIQHCQRSEYFLNGTKTICHSCKR